MSTQQPNILYVTAHCPFGQSYGAQLRALNIGRLLQQVGKVSLVLAAPLSWKIDQEGLDRCRHEFALKRVVRFNPFIRRCFIDRIRHEIDPSFLQTQFFTADEADRKAMLQLIDEHDVVWVHTVRIANAFRINRWSHSVLDVDDIPSRLYASAAKDESSAIRSLLDLRISLIWKRRERLFSNRFDVITVCSEDDKQYIRG